MFVDVVGVAWADGDAKGGNGECGGAGVGGGVSGRGIRLRQGFGGRVRLGRGLVTRGWFGVGDEVASGRDVAVAFGEHDRGVVGVGREAHARAEGRVVAAIARAGALLEVGGGPRVGVFGASIVAGVSAIARGFAHTGGVGVDRGVGDVVAGDAAVGGAVAVFAGPGDVWKALGPAAIGVWIRAAAAGGRGRLVCDRRRPRGVFVVVVVGVVVDFVKHVALPGHLGVRGLGVVLAASFGFYGVPVHAALGVDELVGVELFSEVYPAPLSLCDDA
ncbi:hypothetical protein ES703_90787 [subsurface metagenome]